MRPREGLFGDKRGCGRGVGCLVVPRIAPSSVGIVGRCALLMVTWEGLGRSWRASLGWSAGRSGMPRTISTSVVVVSGR